MIEKNPPHPGTVILEQLTALNLTIEAESAALGISPETLTGIVEGRGRVTPP